IRDAALVQKRTLLSERESKAVLAAFGLPVPRDIAAAGRAAAVAAAAEIGFPVALKILSPDITHKSDVGGVRLNLQNAAMVASAFDDMLHHVRALRPAARIEGVTVQALHDTAVALPPLNTTLARELMGRTNISRLLARYRDIPEVDACALE